LVVVNRSLVEAESAAPNPPDSVPADASPAAAAPPLIRLPLNRLLDRLALADAGDDDDDAEVVTVAGLGMSSSGWVKKENGSNDPGHGLDAWTEAEEEEADEDVAVTVAVEHTASSVCSTSADGMEVEGHSLSVSGVTAVPLLDAFFSPALVVCLHPQSIPSISNMSAIDFL